MSTVYAGSEAGRERSNAPATLSVYGDPSLLIQADLVRDTWAVYDPSLVPLGADLPYFLGNWAGNEVIEAQQADAEPYNGRSVLDLSYLSGPMRVAELAPSLTDRSRTYAPSLVDAAAARLGMPREQLADQLVRRAFKIVNELGDFNWFVTMIGSRYDIKPLEAVATSSLTPDDLRPELENQAGRNLSIAKISTICVQTVTETRLQQADGKPSTIDNPLEPFHLTLQNSLGEFLNTQGKGEQQARDMAARFIGDALLYTHGVLASRFNTSYPEMIYLNLLKLHVRKARGTLDSHDRDSLENDHLIAQWRPWEPREGRPLPISEPSATAHQAYFGKIATR